MDNTSMESRKQQRYKIHDKVIALAFNGLCRLTDISAGGAAIKCIDKNSLPSRWTLDILMVEDNFWASLPVKIAWEKDVPSSSSSTIFTKYVGVQFDDLTRENRSKIDYLIKMHGEHTA